MVAYALFNSKIHSSDRPVYEVHMIKKNIYNTDRWHADHNPVTHNNIDFGNLIADLSHDKRAAIRPAINELLQSERPAFKKRL